MHYLTNFYVFNSFDKYLLRECAICGKSRITQIMRSYIEGHMKDQGQFPRENDNQVET